MSKQKKSRPACKRVLKRHWKLFFVVFFLLGGLGNIGNEIAPVILGCVLAVVFLCWWAIPLWRNRRYEIHATELAEQTKAYEAEKKKRAVEQQCLRAVKGANPTCGDANTGMSVSPSRPSDVASNISAAYVYIPSQIDKCVRKYYYLKVNMQPLSGAYEIAQEMKANNDWILTIQPNGESLDLYYHERPFALLLERKEMVSDWISRNEPLFVILNNLGDDGDYVSIAFYRDEESRLAGRNTSVVKLSGCSHSDVQLNISCLSNGDMLQFDEDEDKIYITIYDRVCDCIGYLPSKVAARYEEEGAAGVFIDHIDYNDETDKYTPYIKIYW